MDKVMENKLIKGAEAVSLFCRLNINSKKSMPLRSSEMGLLILTVKSEMPVTPVMAANFFKVKKPMITAMINPLVNKGYLDKVPSAEDKRSFTLKPTEKAILLVDETIEEYLSVMKVLETKMGNNYEVLIKLLEEANQIILEEKQNG